MATLFGFLSMSCIIFPTAPYKLSPDTRRPIPDKLVEALKPGIATRTDVLLSLGAPEVFLDGERVILYEWATGSGVFGVGSGASAGGGPLSTHYYDLLFEFDGEARLKQSGDLKTLLRNGYGRDQPVDVSTPIEIPIRIGTVRVHPGRLILRPEALRLEEDGKPPRRMSIPPAVRLSSTTGTAVHASGGDMTSGFAMSRGRFRKKRLRSRSNPSLAWPDISISTARRSRSTIDDE